MRLALLGGVLPVPCLPSSPALFLAGAGIQRWPSSPTCMVHFLQGDAGAALSRSRFNPFPPFLLLGSVLPGGWTLTWLEVGGVSGCLELLLSQHLTAAGAGEAATELCRWKTQRRRCSSEHPCGKDPAQQRLGGVRASFRAQHCLGHREHGQGSATLWEPWSTCKSLGEPPPPPTLCGYCWSLGCMCKMPWKIPTPSLHCPGSLAGCSAPPPAGKGVQWKEVNLVPHC